MGFRVKDVGLMVQEFVGFCKSLFGVAFFCAGFIEGLHGVQGVRLRIWQGLVFCRLVAFIGFAEGFKV